MISAMTPAKIPAMTPMMRCAALPLAACLLLAPLHAGAADKPPISQTLEKTEVVATREAVAQSDTDLWQRIRRGFAMDPLVSPLIENHEIWYSARQDYIKRFVERGSKYMYHIVEEVERRNLPTEIVLLPIIESAFNPQAYSRANASGMWQFIPSTGRNFGLKQDWQYDHRRDILMSTDAALDYLEKLHGMFNSWELAFAAYNCGEGCVGRAIAANQRKGLPTDFMSLKLPPETRNYVPKLIAVKNIVLSPGSYGIELDSLQNRPYFVKVTAPAKIDVKLAARLAEMPVDDFTALNPAFSKPVAAGSGYFLVPTDKAEPFKTNLDLYRSLNAPMVSWQAATARRGESLDKVAKRYGLTGSFLRATSGPFKERRGKLQQAITFMVPMQKEARIIDDAVEKQLAMPVATSSSATATAEPVLMTAAAAPADPSAAAPASDATPAASYINAALAPAAPPEIYTVKKGDTLFAIAQRFNLSIEQLKTLNHLDSSQVQIGQNLLLGSVPGSDTVPAATDSNLKPAVANAKTVAPRNISAAPRSYTVRSGDTLFGIAQKFGVTLENLLQWNKLTAKSVLRPGTRLRVS
ncbi:MAG TPA: LysM peptidoglycan-binding domain-containing protein [Usitatibacteraceae bacterium]